MRTVLHMLEGRQGVLAGIAAIAGALLFNDWVLGLWLNRQLFIKGGSVSELNIHTQPHFFVFQFMDILSGVFFSFFALLVRKFMPVISRPRQILIWGTLVFGLANIFDAIFNLPCSESVDKGCYIPVSINPSHYNFPAHGYSSVFIAVLYLLLPLAAVYYARASKNSLFYQLSVLTCVVALGAFASAAWEYLSLHSLSVRASGWVQAVQMVIIGIWFISWYLDVVRPKRSAKAV